MKHLRKLAVLFPLTVILFCSSGCNGIKQIQVDFVKISSYNFNGMKDLSFCALLNVDNPGKKDVALRECQGALKKDDKVLATFEVTDVPVTVGKETKMDVPVNVKAAIVNPMALLFSGLSLDEESLKKSGLTLDGSIIVSYGASRKRFKLKNMTAEELFKLVERL